MKKIKLTRGKFAKVDNEDFEYLNQFTWSFYPSHGAGSKMFKKGGKKKHGQRLKIKYLMHRVIMKAPNGIEVDHKNRDTLDNRKKNLRLATRSQNGMNTKFLSHNKCGVKGVFCETRNGVQLWRVHIKVLNSRFFCSFKTFEEAVTARIIFALHFHGEFAFENHLK